MKASEVTRFVHTHSHEMAHFVRGAADKAGCIVLSHRYESSTILAPTTNHMREYVNTFPAGQQINKLPKLMSGLRFYAVYTDDEYGILSAATKRNRDRSHDPKLLAGIDIVFWGDYNKNRSYYMYHIPGLGTVMNGAHEDRTDYNYTEFNKEYLETMCKLISFDVAVKHIPALLASDRLDKVI